MPAAIPDAMPDIKAQPKAPAAALIAQIDSLFPEFAATNDSHQSGSSLMQSMLHKGIGWKVALGIACCLALPVVARADESSSAPWEWRGLFAYYSEADGRVNALEPVIQGKRVYDDDSSLTLTFSADSLTGASPTGAVPTPDVQTISRPSGAGSLSVPANSIPLDNTFKDFRISAGAEWALASKNNFSWGFGGYFSNEYDYQSALVNGSATWEFNKKNTTLSALLSFGQDTSSPVGQVPVGLGRVPNVGEERNATGGSDTRSLVDVLLALTQVLGQGSLLQVNLSVGSSSGYHNDPYKVLSLVDETGVQTGRIYEKRPDSRQRTALYTALKQRLGNKVLDASYRYGGDDWGVSSTTVELRLRLPTGNSAYVRPMLRLYRQGQADFYRQFLHSNAALPSLASPDARLGNFDATTLGLEFGFRISNKPWSVAIETYTQDGEDDATRPGYLAGRELFPDLLATVIRIGGKF